MLTAETLPRHELVGLHVRVVDASDPTLVGCAGEVVSETTNTLVVDVAHEGRREGSRSVRVPKAVATFEFRLDCAEPRSAADSEDASEYVVVDGERLVARPARRTERTGDSPWQ